MNLDRFRVAQNGKKFNLRKFDSGQTPGIKDSDDAEKQLEKCVECLAEMQERLYAQDNYAVLLIFQAMDAAGKDGTIKMVMSGVNPQGCQVYSFKAPSAEELDHDYMWRYMQRMPERGRIGIFNRSYYEEVLVVRVHQELLAKQKLPPACMKDVWTRRYDDINNIERYLVNNGVIPIKFFLNVSRDEQLKRFLKRLDKPAKNWKFSENDVQERQLWDKYMDAFEEMLQETSTKWAPWYVVPADNKWYMRAVVAQTIVDRMEELDLKFPTVSDSRRKELQKFRKELTEQD